MSAMQTERWFGIKWLGTPFPKRLRARFPVAPIDTPRLLACPVYVAKKPGCGCMARPKSWLLRFCEWLNQKFPYSKGSG